mgnify:CR=1 FL=1
MKSDTLFIATRGSALALAQAKDILSRCQKAFPEKNFDLKIIKTTGDKLQTASLARIDAALPRGLFTKEIEEALLSGEAHLAVHSLKDLPTDLPEGLKLGATPERADVRDVLIYRKEASTARGFQGDLMVESLVDVKPSAVVATSSTRRGAQLRLHRPDLRVVPIRGNVGTRLHKLAEHTELDALILAAAGLRRLGFQVDSEGNLSGVDVPPGLKACFLSTEEMLPCVGQAAIGVEIRADDSAVVSICERLNHWNTWHAVAAERAFLNALGGGCQSAVAAYATCSENGLSLKAVSFLSGHVWRGTIQGQAEAASQLGEEVAGRLKGV